MRFIKAVNWKVVIAAGAGAAAQAAGVPSGVVQYLGSFFGG